jgi:hypothetical protein
VCLCVWQGAGGVFSTGDQKFASGTDALATLREDASNRICADCGEASTGKCALRECVCVCPYVYVYASVVREAICLCADSAWVLVCVWSKSA